MPEWHMRLKIKDLLSDSSDPTEARRIAAIVAQRIKSKFKKALDPENDDYDHELDDCVMCFEDIETSSDFDAVSEFNGSLDQLYDWADGARCWIE